MNKESIFFSLLKNLLSKFILKEPVSSVGNSEKIFVLKADMGYKTDRKYPKIL
jgi:hypothetical protein